MRKEKNKGITLIALIITIIVLLILAGVALATLTGDSGILSNADKAKENTNLANAREQVQLAVQAALIEGLGTVTKANLVTELNNLVGQGKYTITPDSETGPWTVTVNGFTFQVTEEGNIEEVNGIILSKKSLQMLVGDEPVAITATMSAEISGTIEWTSSNTSVATVSNGTITAVGDGEATITAKLTSNGKTYEAECKVTVTTKIENVTSITVQDMELEEGQNAQLTITKTPSNSNEGLTYTSSKPEIATVDDAGRVTAVAEGTTIITVAGKISTDVKGTATITITKPAEPEIGDYVIYNVSYTDMYTDYAFTTSNGWRILDAGTPNGDGTYSNVKLISTGIPALVNYVPKTNAGNASNRWWGTDDQVKDLYGSAYSTGYSNYPGRYAAAGLIENFESIPFTAGPSASENQGCFTKINSTNTGSTTGSIFKATGASEVHNLTLEELNTARGLGVDDTTTSTATTDGDTGLFYLRNLETENSSFGYTSSSEPWYWLPLTDDRMPEILRNMYYKGSFGASNNSTYGVRVVVSLSSNIQKNASGNWEIVP